MDQSTKRCTKCARELSLAEFSKRTDKPGYHAACKRCVAAYSAARYRDNAEVRQRARAYYREHRARVIQASTAWAAANPDLRNEIKRRRRARERATQIVIISPAMLSSKLTYWGGRCWMCGGKPDTWDHVKPLAAGGPHILANLRPACRACNSSKSSRWQGPEMVGP